MLIISLVVSSFLLVVANALAWKSPKAVLGIIPIAIAVVFGFGCLGAGLTAVAIHGIALGLLTGVWINRPGSRRSFACASTGVTVLTYVLIFLLFVRPEQQRYDRLREKYPMEDMTARVPAIQRSGVHLAPAAIQPNRDLEEQVERRASLRDVWALENLHEATASQFVNSPGFGVARMVRPNDYSLKSHAPEPKPISQPGVRDTSAGGEQPPIVVTQHNPFLELHRKSFLDFVNPAGFGYVKNRKQVAGFIPHRFSESPKPPESWSLKTIDLIGLLMHDQPVAYVSQHLPRMDELKSAPTRSLDSFETAGLAELLRGENLYVRQNENSLRMVGAIRAVQQCTTCHGCDRGELLGAFSYVMQSK